MDAQTQWYAAQVRSNGERTAEKSLNKMGYETLVATQQEVRQWSDRRKVIDRVVIPMIVFVKAKANEIKEVGYLSYIYKILGNPGSTKPTPIPDNQIERLKFMLGNSEVPVRMENLNIHKGDTVKIVRGGLKGLEGNVYIDPQGTSKLVITIDCLGCASVEVDMADIESIDKKDLKSTQN